MSHRILGIHHVTAIGGAPATNLDFYTRVLGLRLVKRTVNFDDPTTWHLYFGDRLGRPGTGMTFFPHPRARPGRPGSGEVSRTAFAIPIGSAAYWRTRLAADGLVVNEAQQANQRELTFQDPHGTRLALAETDPAAGVEPWAGGEVPAEAAIVGFESVRLNVLDVQATSDFLRDLFRLEEVSRDDTRAVFDAGGDGPGRRVEVAQSADARAQLGAGSVHHVAFRVADDDAQHTLRQRLVEAGVGVTDVKDRQYFRSIYFREPGGVIFEIATDGPGLTIDESEGELGQQLKLPPWLEPDRAALTQALPALTQETL